ncbi:MAG: mechanosensitive ion channel domain-containing protein [Nitrospirota bacterium]
MMEWLQDFEMILPVALHSLILLAVVLALRLILVRAVLSRESLSVETRRRWAASIRNALALVFIIGLIFIWAHQLSTFAVSLVAIAVALVLATKELILCISGTVLRVGVNAYSMGDRISIGGIRGNVVDQSLLATTVLETGPGHVSSQYTGRAVVFPNSLLMSSPLINETYMKEYIVHVMTIPLTSNDDWQMAEKVLLEIARTECGPFIAEARLHMKQLEGKNWLDAPSVEPRVSLHVPEPGRLNLLLRIPTPAHRTSRVEQAILRRFLQAFKLAGK